MAKTYLALIPCAFLALIAACGSDGVPSMPSVGNAGATGSSGATGQAGAAGATMPGTAGANTAGAAGAAPGGAGSAGAAGASTAGAGGAAPIAGAGGMSMSGGGAGGTPGKVRTGPSAGCGKNVPADDSTTKFIKHEVHMTGIAARFLGPNGADYKKSDVYDYTFRPYSVRLPKNYDSNTKYAVTFGAGGCGGSAANFAKSPGDSFSFAPDGTTIHIGMSMVDGCFEDDGVDNAEVPYLRAIMADIEQKYCFDLSKVFIGGYSSGGWEAYQMGCAASDLVRGFGADEGGLRAQHPPCKNPIAAVMVAGEADTINPIGPLDPTTGKGKELDSYGSGPSKDEILMRNGCVGTDTKPLADPKYPACKQYTGCPAAYPVVWCSLPGVAHNNSTYNGTNYSPGPMWGVLGSLPAP